MGNIGVVIVTYNRVEKLKKCLQLFDLQTVKPKYIIVINNKSTDNTKEYLENWANIKAEYEKYNIENEANLGGSGGFYKGLKEALNLNADWIYVSDDDAFPEIDTIEKCEKFLGEYKDNKKLVAFCTKVLDKGKIAHIHRKTIKKGIFKLKEKSSKEEDYRKDFFEINTFSYVGAVMNKELLIRYGITNKEYFIYYDDVEHSYRLSKYGKILCVPSIIVHHDSEPSSNKANSKIYYFIRNRLIWYKSVGKRFYYYELFKRRIILIVRKILRQNTKSQNLIKQALKDAKKNKMGKYDI